MSDHSEQTPGAASGGTTAKPSHVYHRENVDRYIQANQEMEATRKHLADASEAIHELEGSEDVAVFQKQIDLLKRRLYEQPEFFHQVFISEGSNAITWEFQQPELGKDFICAFWNLLTREDAMSTVLMRFIWNVPLGYKRKFIRALDYHMTDRYPMFKGLSQGWPAENGISPYIRPPAERSKDFDLVSQGYLGYMGLGYSAREVELLVWLEVLRDKQCEDGPCQVGVEIPDQEEPKGGCPVRIHIPEVLRLMGEGKFRNAMELITQANPLPMSPAVSAPRKFSARVSASRPSARSRSARSNGICRRA
jgi:glutamate synthase (NADPH/NADH) small chain